jgi:hypothetical protein
MEQKMKRVPMPSPRGTNLARLYVSARWSNPVAAYDAAEGLQATGEVTPAKAVYAKLVAALSPKDLRELRDLLQTEKIDEYAAVDQSEGATDEPPDFPGKPLIAQDRALRRPYDAALRACQRIRVI